jgi:hypothetical protein
MKEKVSRNKGNPQDIKPINRFYLAMHAINILDKYLITFETISMDRKKNSLLTL